MEDSAGYEAGGHQHPTGPAPGSALFSAFPELWGRAICLDFVNSLQSDHTGGGKRYDLLPLPGWQNAFLELWKLRLDDPREVPPLAVMVNVRKMVRDGLERWGRGETPAEADVRELNTILGLAPLNRTLASGGAGYTLEVSPSARNWTWVLTEVIVSMFALIDEGKPARLRKCANPDCSWLYYDESQARSRRWCSPGVCGNLSRVRRFRTRQKGEGTQHSRQQ